ncbi:hypothetical protein RND81_06G171400 [Saponaria officinalis]|uniref:Uncharacterized protein n=1 Tax=Saponaria officinalis TaxID=3572 RepID=A0AAW1KCL6_SAPOF
MRTNRITFEVLHIVKKAGAYGAESLPPHHQRYMSAPTTGWKSPVPYLFGGLAAMLGLIAFALLILACSYWKLSGHMNSGDNSGENSGDEKVKETEMKAADVFPNSFLVIMAGEEKPTFLATPAVSSWSRSCSYSCSCSGSNDGQMNQLTTTTTTMIISEEEKR